jgi:phosphoserine phosphatase RsbU/P
LKHLVNKISLDKQKLEVILNITKQINSNASTVEILEIFKAFLIQSLNVYKVALYIHQYQKWICLINDEVQEKNKFSEIPPDLLEHKEIQPITSNDEAFYNGYDILVPIYHKAEPLAYLLIGDLIKEDKGMSPSLKHTQFIQTLANIIVVAIENKRLTKETIAREALKAEIELATRMQKMLFPSNLPDDEKLQISAHYQPFSGLGGDYYDYQILNKDEVYFCVADVSGKGTSAAILMSNFQANLRAYMATQQSLKEIIQILNKTVLESAKGEKFITCFLGQYNFKTKKLTYINAGHHPAILCKNNKVFWLTEGCVGVGMLDNIPKIELGEIEIEKNDFLVAYTDGLVEVENDNGEQFDLKNIVNLLLEKAFETMEELNEFLLSKMDEYRQEREFTDDVTLLSIKFK